MVVIVAQGTVGIDDLSLGLLQEVQYHWPADSEVCMLSQGYTRWETAGIK
jgi:hypothetical protein